MIAGCRRIVALPILFAVLVAARVTAPVALDAQSAPVANAPALPDRLSDAEFWKLVGDLSEATVAFSGGNFVSNEGNIGAIAGAIRKRGPHGGVYIGVGPEQNFTYIAAVRPRMAFVVDIRREVVMQQLLFKALFELSTDRADFISLLFALPRPAGLDATAPIQQIWMSYANVAASASMQAISLERVTALLTQTHGFAFTAQEQAMLERMYSAFFQHGPSITTTPSGRGAFAVAGPQPQPLTGAARNPTFVNLTMVTDSAGRLDSFLASDEDFQFLKGLQARNLIVPVSGDFGGAQSVRGVGQYLKAHGATVSAFYVSNVEEYLFRDGTAARFYDNVAGLPTDGASVFIRPTVNSDGFVQGGASPSGGIGVSLCPIAPFLRLVAVNGVVEGSGATLGPSWAKMILCRM